MVSVLRKAFIKMCLPEKPCRILIKYIRYTHTRTLHTKKIVTLARTRNLKTWPQCSFYNLDGALFLKKRFVYACLRCFSLLIVLLESMMQSVVLLFCCVFIIAHCRISKKQASSAGCLLVGRGYRGTKRGVREILRNEWPADGQAIFNLFNVLLIYFMLLCCWNEWDIIEVCTYGEQK